MAITEKLKAIANAIRGKTGKEDLLTLEGMAVEVERFTVDDGSYKAVIERTATEPTLPSDLTKIASYAFYKNTALVKIKIPSEVLIIDSDAVRECNNLVSVELPEKLYTIGSAAFRGCVKLEELTLPENVESIGASAFYGCSGLKKVTYKGIPNIIQTNAFANCSNLKTINVPWGEGEVASAPWGATNATINYNYTGEE